MNKEDAKTGPHLKRKEKKRKEVTWKTSEGSVGSFISASLSLSQGNLI
jgi:hypothetical protein